MSKKPLIFFGSGPVGLASLKALVDDFDVTAVITKPDPKSSRAPRLVSAWAQEHGLALHQPPDAAGLIALFEGQLAATQAGVVVDYGLIIPKKVIDQFELGIINSHFSLLPQWRGADPITFALLSGQKQTGVSLMKIVEELDAGDLLAQAFYDIEPDDTNLSLTDRLVELSSSMLKEVLPKYLNGEIQAYPQDTSQQPTYSRKLTKSDGHIDWSKPAAEIEREIRAFLGWPGSYTTLNSITFVVKKATQTDERGRAGTPFRAGKGLGVYCGRGALVIEELQPAGKKAMDSASFLNGYPQILEA